MLLYAKWERAGPLNLTGTSRLLDPAFRRHIDARSQYRQRMPILAQNQLDCGLHPMTDFGAGIRALKAGEICA